MAGPSHLYQAASYITHGSWPPLHLHRPGPRRPGVSQSTLMHLPVTHLSLALKVFESTDTNTHVSLDCSLNEFYMTGMSWFSIVHLKSILTVFVKNQSSRETRPDEMKRRKGRPQCYYSLLKQTV